MKARTSRVTAASHASSFETLAFRVSWPMPLTAGAQQRTCTPTAASSARPNTKAWS
jgi:hypothetical protein